MANPKEQAKNLVELSRGNSVYNIERALRLASKEVVEELKTQYKAVDIPSLALKMAYS